MTTWLGKFKKILIFENPKFKFSAFENPKFKFIVGLLENLKFKFIKNF